MRVLISKDDNDLRLACSEGIDGVMKHWSVWGDNHIDNWDVNCIPKQISRLMGIYSRCVSNKEFMLHIQQSYTDYHSYHPFNPDQRCNKDSWDGAIYAQFYYWIQLIRWSITNSVVMVGDVVDNKLNIVSV